MNTFNDIIHNILGSFPNSDRPNSTTHPSSNNIRQTRNNNISTNQNSICKSCDTKIQVLGFKRKFICQYCGEIYCRQCVTNLNGNIGNGYATSGIGSLASTTASLASAATNVSGPTSNLNHAFRSPATNSNLPLGSQTGVSLSSHVICNRCVVFTRQEMSWHELRDLRVKDLRWFLTRNRISFEGCKEKEQLVDLILELYGGENHQIRQSVFYQRAQNLREEMNENFQSQDLLQPNDCFLSASQESLDNQMDAHTSVSDSPADILPNPPVDPPHYSTIFTHQDQPNTHQPVESQPRSANFSGKERVLLEELSGPGDLDLLSARQLKDLLALNCVDFRGCVERSELVSRARRLYASHCDNQLLAQLAEEQQQQSTGGLLSSSPSSSPLPATSHPQSSQVAATCNPVLVDPDANLCRICIDRAVDCVFLECGHSVTCIGCGKQLAECPICRQNIVRVVRIFRS